MYRARPHLRSDARRREDAQALAEGELLCSRPVPRGWTSAGGPSVSDRRWCRLDRQRRLLNRLWLLTLGSRARPVAEPVHREGGSPCKSAVTEFTHPTRYGATGYDRLRPGITGQSRHFLIERTGCDPLRPAAARQSLCGTCVVDVMPVATTSAVTERMRHACLADGTIIATSHFVIRVGRRIYRGGNCRNSVAIRDASRCLVRQQNDCLFRLVVPRPVPYTP